MTIRLLFVLLAIYVLQYFPYTGILMMFGMALAGPYLWGLLPHLLTVGLLLDVRLARLPKATLAIPLLFYVAYYAFLAFEWFVVREYAKNMAQTNSLIAIAYDAKEHSIVSPNAAQLVKQFGVPLAFEPNKDLPLGFLSSRLISKQRCDQIRPVERDLFELRPFSVHVPDKNSLRRIRLLSQCALSNHEAPTKKKLEVTIRNVSHRQWGVDFEVTYHDIGLEQRQLGTVATARVNRLPWFPFYLVGCFLNSSKPAWECEAGFHRQGWNLPDSENAGQDFDNSAGVIAKALGLTPYTMANYDQFEDFAENAQFVDSWLLRKKMNRTSDYNEWGVEKISPYMPRLSIENGREHYVGGIYPRKEGGEFLDFIKRNVGKTVQITADIGSGVNVSPTQKLLQIWGVCKNSDACARTDHAFKLEGAEGSIFVKKRITGFWKVGEFSVDAKSGADKDTITILERVFP